jgi:Gas vesicle synthesis protein GvpO
MADEQVERRSRDRAKQRRASASKDATARSERKLPSRKHLAEEARRQLAEITGMDSAGVTALERSDEDGWKVTVELVELARIPRAADVLGVYEVKLDRRGALEEYRRVRRYSRGQGGPENG